MPPAVTSQPVTLHTAAEKPEHEQVERLFNTLVAAKKESGGECFGQPRFVSYLRAEEDRRDSEAVWLPGRRNSLSNSRTGTWKLKAKAKGERLRCRDRL